MAELLRWGQEITFVGRKWTVEEGCILMSCGNHEEDCQFLESLIPFPRTKYKCVFNLEESPSMTGYFPCFHCLEDLSKFVHAVNCMWESVPISSWAPESFADAFQRKELGIERK